MPFGFDSGEPTGPAVLIVEPDDRARKRLCSAFAERLIPTFDVPQAFDAMNTLGRADFGAVVVREGRRRLSIRGLLQLALRSHPEIHLVVLSDAPLEEVQQGLGIPVATFASNTDPYHVAEAVSIAMDEAAGDVESFEVGDEPTEQMKRPGAGFVPAPVTGVNKPRPAPPPAKAAAAKPEKEHVPWRVEVEERQEIPPELERTQPMAPLVDLDMDFDEASVDVTMPMTTAPSFDETTLEPSVPNEPAMPSPTINIDKTQEEIPLPALKRLAAEAAASLGSPSLVDSVEEPIDISVEQVALIEGDLYDHAGCPLLITLSARELTGRLQLEETGHDGALYFFRGDPVFAEPNDPEVLRARARAKGVDLKGIVVEPGEDLFSALAAGGRVSGAQLHEMLLTFLRERVFALASEDEGGFAFFEEDAFVRQRPMIRVNAFGMILDSRRRRTPPGELLKMSADLNDERIRPLPPLELASHKLLPFTRDVDLAKTIGTGVTFQTFLEMTGLDPMMGTLVVLAMDDARLIEIGGGEFEENTARISLAATVSRVQGPTSGFGGGTAEILEPLPARAARIRTLAASIGDSRDPWTVLGVPEGAEASQIHGAYDDRMRTVGALFLDESTDAELRATAVALKHRLGRAYRTLTS